jgi:AraC family transcriptional regulator
VPSTRDLLHLLHDIRRRLADDVSLQSLAAGSGWSAFHLHRAFHKVVRETPKRYTQRLRLERAAARLLTTNDPILTIALDSGFASHEVFTRAFGRHFGVTPARYRSGAPAAMSPLAKARHRVATEATGPCIGLFRMSLDPTVRRSSMPMLTIERRELPAQPALVVRRRTARADLPATLADCFGRVFGHCHKAGLPMDGRPFVRYISTGPGLWTIEAGKPMAAASPGDGDIEARTLPAGPAVVAIHGGAYDQLGDTYAAMEKWMEENGLRPGEAPWESYVTDPAEHPDPGEWRTEIYWPIAG